MYRLLFSCPLFFDSNQYFNLTKASKLLGPPDRISSIEVKNTTAWVIITYYFFYLCDNYPSVQSKAVLFAYAATSNITTNHTLSFFQL